MRGEKEHSKATADMNSQKQWDSANTLAWKLLHSLKMVYSAEMLLWQLLFKAQYTALHNNLLLYEAIIHSTETESQTTHTTVA